MVRHTVENHVITLSAPGEILSRVIHHLVGAERSHHIHIPRTAYSGHFGAKGLGDLDGKRTDASGAPLIKTFWRCGIWPLPREAPSRRACNAVNPAIGREAAFSKV